MIEKLLTKYPHIGFFFVFEMWILISSTIFETIFTLYELKNLTLLTYYPLQTKNY